MIPYSNNSSTTITLLSLRILESKFGGMSLPAFFSILPNLFWLLYRKKHLTTLQIAQFVIDLGFMYVHYIIWLCWDLSLC